MQKQQGMRSDQIRRGGLTISVIRQSGTFHDVTDLAEFFIMVYVARFLKLEVHNLEYITSD